jgi:hypothetical protein
VLTERRTDRRRGRRGACVDLQLDDRRKLLLGGHGWSFEMAEMVSTARSGRSMVRDGAKQAARCLFGVRVDRPG